MTSDAPVKVAECPPRGVGGTPSICGNAQSHFLSIPKQIVINRYILPKSLTVFFSTYLPLLAIIILILGSPDYHKQPGPRPAIATFAIIACTTARIAAAIAASPFPPFCVSSE